MSGKNKATATQVVNQLPTGQQDASAPTLPCAANKDPQLKVKVFATIKGKTQAVQATVMANALTANSSGKAGLADFSHVLPGTYNVQVSAILAPDDEKFYVTDATAQVTLAKGDKQTLKLEVKPRNVVTPKLEVEYKVVLLDPELFNLETVAHDPPATELRPQPTRVEASLTCSEQDPAYDAEVTLDAPGCDVFLDEACTQPLNRKLTVAELTGGQALPLYLRGKAAGLFELKLAPTPMVDARYDVQEPAKVEMGVVKLELKVHEHVTPINVTATNYPLKGHCADLENANLIPDQLPLSDTDKVNKGRLLHKQIKQHHGRAKAIVHITAGEWPPGADDHLVVVRSTGTDLSVHDAETKGKKNALPWKLKVGELKTADQVFWVQGSDTSKQVRGSRLSIGLDRPSGGLAKAAKTHADWTRFTVVHIASVKLHHEDPGAGQPKPHDAAKHRWFINLQAGAAGRTVKIRAKLSQKLAGIPLHFMLSPDEHNLTQKNWGIDLPASWNWGNISWDVKQKDRDNDTDLLHMSEDTDADGMAECELVLSQFGGDRFVPAAYIGQDPHLAAYVHGHDTLADRKPKLADDPIKVSRKFWLQRIAVKHNGKTVSPNPGVSNAKDQYGRVRAILDKAKSTSVNAPAGSCYPKSMIVADGGKSTGLLVSDLNKGTLFAGVAVDPEKPVKVPLLICDAQWDDGGDTTIDIPWDNLAGDIDLTAHLQSLIVIPFLDGTATVVSGNIRCKGVLPDGSGTVVNGPNHAIADADLKVKLHGKGGYSVVTLKLPDAIKAFARQHQSPRIRIAALKLKIAEGPYLGESSGGNIMAVYDPKQTQDFQNTIVHELGHFFGHTLTAADVTGLSAAGMPAIPSQYISWLDIADASDPRTSGSHCHTASTPYVHATSGRPGYADGKCVMYEEGPIAGSYNRFCDVCHPYVLVTDMAK